MSTTPAKHVAVKRAPKAEKKPVAAKKAVVKPEGAYIYALGRRKSAIAQVRLYPKGAGHITINGKPVAEYLGVEELRESVNLPLKALGMDKTTDIVCITVGGGLRGQADAIKLGVARALYKMNPDVRLTLKPHGFFTRDPREKERKKYGLKKARKSPQWAKR